MCEGLEQDVALHVFVTHFRLCQDIADPFNDPALDDVGNLEQKFNEKLLFWSR